jgi:glycosyltransferase involved in cell wall biosynthesis
MKTSIALAIYNGEKYLQEQLDSYLAQTVLPDELIVSDDCSSDNTQKILIDFAKKAPFRVVLLCNIENVGFAQNFSRALSQTTGDLIFLSDQDDVWFPEKIATMITYAEENPEYALYMHDALHTDSSLSPVGVRLQQQMRAIGAHTEHFVTGCCAMFRQEYLQKWLPVPEGVWGHDTWLVGCADAIKKKCVIKKSLMYYRRHECNTAPSLVANVKRVTLLQMFREKKQSTSSGEWEKEQMRNAASAEAQSNGLLKVADNSADLEESSAYRTFAKQKKELALFIQQRIKVRQEKINLRILKVFQWYFLGKYDKYASGIKSACLDIFFNRM